MAIPVHSAGHGTHFITSASFNRRRLFQTDANAILFLETLQHYRKEGRYKLHAFVVMPDHIHLLITPQEITIERAMGLIKVDFRIGSPHNFRYGSVVSPLVRCAVGRSLKPDGSTSIKILYAPAWPRLQSYIVSRPPTAPQTRNDTPLARTA
jgi:hypothetical protein